MNTQTDKDTSLLQLVHITFPELHFQRSAGHQLRGYIGNLFKEYSPLLHNHLADGSLRNQYPLVQYKVVDQKPFIIGIGEGAGLLTELFLKLKELVLEDRTYPIHHKNIVSSTHQFTLGSDLYTYTFKNPWMSLNQTNHARWLQSDEEQKQQLLKRILVGNILSFLKGVGIHVKEQILCNLNVKAQTTTGFKDQQMLAFSGSFVSNIDLPDYVGLGKAVSRGYGTLTKAMH